MKLYSWGTTFREETYTFINDIYLVSQMSLVLRAIQNHREDVNHLVQMVFPRMISQGSPMHRNLKTLIRDQNLKDIIMAVQRRIPR